jgi:predicted ATPase
VLRLVQSRRWLLGLVAVIVGYLLQAAALDLGRLLNQPFRRGSPDGPILPVFCEGVSMPSYVLTGAPGAGKTAIVRQLEVDGYRVVAEAATDVIALEQALGQPEPWTSPAFIDKIVELQRRRQAAAATQDGDTVFYDRSPVCTLALSRYLGCAESARLAAEVDRVLAAGVYASTVFFVRSLGFVTPTAARRISLADSLAFEEVHRRTYTGLGFRLVDVPAGPLLARVGLVRRGAGLAA